MGGLFSSVLGSLIVPSGVHLAFRCFSQGYVHWENVMIAISKTTDVGVLSDGTGAGCPKGRENLTLIGCSFLVFRAYWLSWL